MGGGELQILGGFRVLVPTLESEKSTVPFQEPVLSPGKCDF
jgi:hypothetical protein